MKILYLEDDIDLSQTVEEFLIDAGLDVICVYDGEEALEIIYKENFDMFLLDVNVPNISGFELLKELRDANITTPAIFTTSLNSIDDLSLGYDSGADDYVKKPFALKELLFRIKALLKREFKAQSQLIEITKEINFDTNKNELIEDNKKVGNVQYQNIDYSTIIGRVCTYVFDGKNFDDDYYLDINMELMEVFDH